jgi:16S rRNA (guanine527-N7)-methyltransferase
MNLTSIVDPEEISSKHFIDSLTLIKTIRFGNQTILDVGSGAGFPALPLKIVFPNLQVTLIDSTRKKIDFLKRLTNRLDLRDVTLIHGRVEEHPNHEFYDLVVARAVAKLAILAELCLPFVKVGGQFIAMKSSHYEDELQEAAGGIQLLGGSVKQIDLYPVEEDAHHALIVIQKNRKTPAEYPRTFAKIKKQPL